MVVSLFTRPIRRSVPSRGTSIGPRTVGTVEPSKDWTPERSGHEWSATIRGSARHGRASAYMPIGAAETARGIAVPRSPEPSRCPSHRRRHDAPLWRSPLSRQREVAPRAERLLRGRCRASQLAHMCRYGREGSESPLGCVLVSMAPNWRLPGIGATEMKTHSPISGLSPLVGCHEWRYASSSSWQLDGVPESVPSAPGAPGSEAKRRENVDVAPDRPRKRPDGPVHRSRPAQR